MASRNTPFLAQHRFKTGTTWPNIGPTWPPRAQHGYLYPERGRTTFWGISAARRKAGPGNISISTTGRATFSTGWLTVLVLLGSRCGHGQSHWHIMNAYLQGMHTIKNQTGVNLVYNINYINYIKYINYINYINYIHYINYINYIKYINYINYITAYGYDKCLNAY